MTSFGQFSLSPNGTFVNEATGNDFLVKTYEGLTQKELKDWVFNKALESDATKAYKLYLSGSSDDKVTVIGNTSFRAKNSFAKITFDYKFEITTHFKEDKIRSSIVLIELESGGYPWSASTLYSKKGEVKKAVSDVYNELNKVTNHIISQFFYVKEVVEW